jgi:poly-gamma-glutamate system protein
MTALKFRLVKEHNSKLLISIGGSHANLGADDDVLRLPPGLILAPQSGAGGNGVIANALNDGLPVIHMLHLKRLCAEVGLPFDSEPTKQAPNRISFLGAIAGILIFLIALLRYRRWRLIAEAG